MGGAIVCVCVRANLIYNENQSNNIQLNRIAFR